MVRLIITNKDITITGASRKTIMKLEDATSYMVAGAYFSSAYKRKVWDGKEHLLTFHKVFGYRTPIGLLEDIVKVLRDNKIDFRFNTKNRRKQTKFVEYKWNDSIVLRDYQRKAVKKMMREKKSRGILKAVGIFNLAIRSGKTKTVARVIFETGARTLFVVTSNTLLYQAKESLEESLGVKVGVVGDGEWTPGHVTVAMAQSLASAAGGIREYIDSKTGKKRKKRIKRLKKFTELVGKFDMIVFDECHHLTSQQWHKTMLEFDSIYRIGLSATIFFGKKSESEKGNIWLKACCGNIRERISASYLIERGWLMRPKIKIYKISKPSNLQEHRWSQDLHSRAIFLNRYRNKKICRLAVKYVKKGLRVLVVSNRLAQVAALKERLHTLGANFDTVTGTTMVETRNAAVKRFSNGECPILLGTVFKEGVDIPEIEVVINAEGGKDVKMAMQRMRNLTAHEGKTEAIYIDFDDLTNPYFKKHSRARLNAYKSEPAFLIEHIQEKKSS